MDRLQKKTQFLTPALFASWGDALEAPIDCTTNWLHDDLHPYNILVNHGSFSGIIDWGDITRGDISTDLVCIWMVFADSTARQQALKTYGPISEATRKRAIGWAILFGVVLLDTGLVDHPAHAVIGERALLALCHDLRQSI